MIKKQILDFIKAPFSRSFIVAYFFSLFSLLTVPLISKIFRVFVNEYKELKDLSQDEATKMLLKALKDSINYSDISLAVIGGFIAFFMLSLYCFVLTHKTILEERDIFDVSCLTVKITEIIQAFMKYLGYTLIFTVGMAFPFLLSGVLTLIGVYLHNTLSIIIFIISFLLLFLALYKSVCYLYTASLIFYKEFNLSVFFKYNKIKQIFSVQKQNIFISFLLSYVLGQVVYVIYSSMCANIIQQILLTGVISEVFNLSCEIFIALGLMILNFFFVYLTILQAIAFGKIILWVNQKIN